VLCAPPAGIASPVTARWTIRPARSADVPVLAFLERACFTPPWSETLLRLELGASGSLVLAAESARAGGLEGYAVFRTIADEAELLRVAVLPKRRGEGLGRLLVETGLEGIARRGARRCFLEVRRNNTAAIALYLSLEFVETGHRPGYYPDGVDALLMVRSLAGPPRGSEKPAEPLG